MNIGVCLFEGGFWGAPRAPHLIYCPKSRKTNFKKEGKKWLVVEPSRGLRNPDPTLGQREKSRPCVARGPGRLLDF